MRVCDLQEKVNHGRGPYTKKPFLPGRQKGRFEIALKNQNGRRINL